MSGTHGLLQSNRPGYFYITLEESYVTLFKISAENWYEGHKGEKDADKKRNARVAHAVAKAYITDVLANLSNDLYKSTKSENNLWVFLSFPQLESRLHGGVKMRTLKDAMKELIEDGYVFKQPNRDPRYKALEYRLNLPKFRKELESLPSKPNKGDSAKLHDEIDDAKLPFDSAKLHCDSANLHDVSAKLHDENANLHPKRNIDVTDKHNKDERKKEKPTIVQEPQPLSQPDALSPSLSQKKKEETKPLEVGYPLFDYLYRQKPEYGSSYKASRNEKSDKAIQDLKNQGATVEQVEFVFNDIYDDKDPWWKSHRTPSSVASQFDTRIWKMAVSAPKRRTVSGFTNYTENKSAGVPAIKPVQPVEAVPEKQEKPKFSLPVGYTRAQFKENKPARPRTLQGRLQQQAKEQ